MNYGDQLINIENKTHLLNSFRSVINMCVKKKKTFKLIDCMYTYKLQAKITNTFFFNHIKNHRTNRMKSKKVFLIIPVKTK